MKRRPPPIEQTEQVDQATLDLIDDGELCAYELVNGELVETVTRPVTADQRRSRCRGFGDHDAAVSAITFG